MATNTVWYVNGPSIGGNSLRVDITKPLGTPVTEEQVEGSPGMFTIKWGEEVSGDNLTSKFQPLQRSYCEVIVVDDGTNKYLDFFDSDIGEYIVEIKINLSVFWTGISKPGLYSSQVGPHKRYVKLTFTDGLSELGNTPFFMPDYDNRKTLIEVINHSLKQTGFDFPLFEAVNVYEENNSQGDDDSVLDQVNMAPDYYYVNRLTFDDFLIDINTTFTSRLFVWESAWYMTRIPEYSGTYLEREFDIDGDIVANSGTFKGITRAATNYRLINPEENFSLSVPKAERIDINIEDKTKQNFVANGHFEGWALGGTFPPDDWTADPSGVSITNSTDRVTGSFSAQLDPHATPATAKYIEHIIPSVLVDGKLIVTLRTLGGYTSILDSERPRLVFSMKYDTFWLEGAGGDPTGNWVGSEEKLSIADSSQTPGTKDWYTFTVDIPINDAPVTPSTAFPLTIRLYEQDDTSRFDSAIFGHEPFQYQALPAINNGSVNVGSGDIEQTMDLYNGRVNTNAYDRDISNYIISPDGSQIGAIQNFNRRGVTESISIPEIALLAIESETVNNVMVLNAEIRYDSLDMRYPIIVPALGDKRFIPNGVTYYPVEETWRGQWIEVISSPVYSGGTPI